MTEKWDEIQGKLDLVRVSGEFELSGFYCKLKYLLYFFPAATWSDLFETESGILEVSLCSFPKCDFFCCLALCLRHKRTQGFSPQCSVSQK